MEGAFGRHKNHYNLNKKNARTAKTEIIWLFFGIHTGNSLESGRRIAEAEKLKQKIA